MNDYKIVSYIDSNGCVSCKLQLLRWKEIMQELDSVAGRKLTYCFFFAPLQVKELEYLLHRDEFDIPICIDETAQINSLNNFPNEYILQTFLLDADNRVVCIGNPTVNPQIKKLFFNILIIGKSSSDNIYKTIVEISTPKINFGELEYGQTYERIIYLRNKGDNPFALSDYSSSCGCVSVGCEFNPVAVGDSLPVCVRYKADRTGYFIQTLRLYGNMQGTYMSILLSGSVKK